MSIALTFFDLVLRFTMKRRFDRSPEPGTLRAIMESGKPRPVPRGVTIAQTELGGVPVEKLAREDDASRAILYVHGGGFVAGSPRTHRAITGRLAARVAPVWAVDYRLAPEHPFPAAIDDVLAVYRALVERDARVVIGGDSAGGCLTLAVMHAILEARLPKPRALFAISPVTDFVEAFPSRRENARSDAMFTPEIFDALRPAYIGGADRSNARLSPFRGDVREFPPTLLQCARGEMLRDDSVYFANKLRDAGVPVKLDVWERVFHAWPIAADFVPEGRSAIDDIVAFVAPKL